MSLINNMLKDLERRDHTSKFKPAIVAASTTKRFPSLRFGDKEYWLGACLSLLLVVCYFIYPAEKIKPALPQISQPAAALTSNPSGAINNDVLWLTKTTINGISLQEKDHITEISFLLDHPALYRLVSNDASNQLSIIIDNAQFQSQVPQTQSMRTALQSIKTANGNGSVIFSLIMQPNSVIKYVNLTADKKNPELVIAIEHSNGSTEQPVATAQNDMVKMPAMQTLYNEQYQSALKYAGNGELQKAIEQLSTLIEAQPSYQDARVTLAALLIDQGSSQRAAKVIDAGLRLSPDSIPLIELKARQLTAQGQIKKALALLQSVSPPITSNPEYHAFIAALYQKNDNNLLAVKLYKRLLAINPQNGNWWFGLGLSLEKLGENSLAFDAYSKAIADGNINQDSLAYLQSHMQALQENDNETE